MADTVQAPTADAQGSFDPVAAARQKFPGLNDQPDDKVGEFLSEPTNFRSTFPEYSHLDDQTIVRNMADARTRATMPIAPLPPVQPHVNMPGVHAYPELSPNERQKQKELIQESGGAGALGVPLVVGARALEAYKNRKQQEDLSNAAKGTPAVARIPDEAGIASPQGATIPTDTRGSQFLAGTSADALRTAASFLTPQSVAVAGVAPYAPVIVGGAGILHGGAGAVKNLPGTLRGEPEATGNEFRSLSELTGSTALGAAGVQEGAPDINVVKSLAKRAVESGAGLKTIGIVKPQPEEALTRAIQPGVNIPRAQESIPIAGRRLQQVKNAGLVTDEQGNQITEFKSNKDILQGVKAAKKYVYSALRDRIGSVGKLSTDTTGAADAMVDSISRRTRDQYPGITKKIEDRAETLRGTRTFEEIEQHIQDINDDLGPMYARGQANPNNDSTSAEITATDAEVKYLRNLLDDKVKTLTGSGTAKFKREYGALRDVERASARQYAIETRQKGATLWEGLAALRAAGDFVSGNLLGAAKGGATIAVGRRMANVRSPQWNIDQAFQGPKAFAPSAEITPAPGPRVAGLLPEGPKITPAPADRSGPVDLGKPRVEPLAENRQLPAAGRSTGPRVAARPSQFGLSLPAENPRPLTPPERQLPEVASPSNTSLPMERGGRGPNQTPPPFQMPPSSMPPEGAPPVPKTEPPRNLPHSNGAKATLLSESPKIETDSNGIKWAIDKDGVRISIPKRIPEGEVSAYAREKLAEQRNGQKAIKSVREVMAQAPTTSRGTSTAANAPASELPAELHADLEKQAGHALTKEEAIALDRSNLERGMTIGKPDESTAIREEHRSKLEAKGRPEMPAGPVEKPEPGSLSQIKNPRAEANPAGQPTKFGENFDKPGRRSTEQLEKFDEDTLAEAKQEVNAMGDMWASMPRPGRYVHDAGFDPANVNQMRHESVAYGINSARPGLESEFPWLKNLPKMTEGKLRAATESGKGVEYTRLLNEAGKHIRAAKVAAMPILEEYRGQLEDAAKQVEAIDPDLARSLRDTAAGKFSGMSGLRSFIKDRLHDAASAAAFDKAIGELSQEELSESAEGPSRESHQAREATDQENVTPGPRHEEAEGAEGVLPGLEKAVTENKAAAGKFQGEELTRAMRAAGRNISQRTGEMETKSPLFRGTEASPQREIFGTPGGSGESAASQEAINRTTSEARQGVKYFIEDSRSGERIPLSSIDAHGDMKLGPTKKIIQVGPHGESIFRSASGTPIPRKHETNEDTMQNPDTRATAAQHEAGHAVIGEMMRPGSVEYTSLGPKGGETSIAPPAGKKTVGDLSRDDIHDMLTTSFAGAAAEPRGTTVRHASGDMRIRNQILGDQASTPGQNAARILFGETVGRDPMLDAPQDQAAARARVQAYLADPKIQGKIQEIAGHLGKRGRLTGDELRKLLK